MNDKRQQPKRITIVAIAGAVGILGLASCATKAPAKPAEKNGHPRERASMPATRKSKPAENEKDRPASFPRATPDVQPEKLRKDFAAEKLPRMGRHIGPASRERIRTLLKDAPALDVEILSPDNDPEALAFAGDFRKLFESAGMKVRKNTGHTELPNKLPGVSIYSRPQLDDSLGSIIGEIFTAISEPIQWEKEATTFNMRDPDLRI
ncbi:MAG: hypothetical protein ABIP20_01000, partial [Chthoniobacteraceae bacterium]